MSTLEESTGEFRHKGHVKFFNSTKGYGFILPDNPKEVLEGENMEEVFVHHTAIHNSGGFKSLAEGEQVEYDLVQGPKGMQASNVTGPNGASVQGDPRTHRQPYPSGNNGGGYRGNNNRGSPYNGYMMDPYGSGGNGNGGGVPFGYAAIPAPGYPFMNIYQQQQLPPHIQAQQFQQYYSQQQQQQQHQQGGGGSPNQTHSSTSPQLLQQAYSGYIPNQQQQPMYYNNNYGSQQQQQTTPPQGGDESS